MESNRQEIVVQDACILFDLMDLGLLPDFFQLNLVVYTTPQVIDEIKIEEQRVEVAQYIDTGKLLVDLMGRFEDVYPFTEEFPALSFADSSVLELALRRNAVIFSSDGSLRKISNRKEIIVRGTLWIIEELFTQNMIDRGFAISRLEMYSTVNRRAPLKQIESLISRLMKEH